MLLSRLSIFIFFGLVEQMGPHQSTFYSGSFCIWLEINKVHIGWIDLNSGT